MKKPNVLSKNPKFCFWQGRKIKKIVSIFYWCLYVFERCHKIHFTTIAFLFQVNAKMDRVELAFRKFDLNKDGYLSREEFDIVRHIKKTISRESLPNIFFLNGKIFHVGSLRLHLHWVSLISQSNEHLLLTQTSSFGWYSCEIYGYDCGQFANRNIDMGKSEPFLIP